MSDITAIRGDNESYDVTVTDAAGQRVDLTGSAMWFTVKLNQTDPDLLALVRKSTYDSGITLATQSGATLGMATIDLLPADTSKLLAPKSLFYDVQLKTPNGKITTIVEGDFDLIADITRTTTS